jgi:3-methylcrotonyl-CoA carboxylase alpha subunit
VREGDTISPFYDSMVAKLIVHGATRQEALARMDAALAETRIVGLSTNVQFLRHVVNSPSFAQANLDTALIPREAAVLFHQDKVGLALAVASAVAQTLVAERAQESTDPFSRRDGWRPHGLTVRRFDFEYLDEALLAHLTYLHDGALQLAFGDVNGVLRFETLPTEGGARMDLQFQGQRQTVQTWQQGETVHIFCALGATQITEIDALAHAGVAAADGGRLTAPMPGKVLSFAEGGRRDHQGAGAGGDGGHEDGTHHRRSRRRHRGRAAVCARRPGERRRRAAQDHHRLMPVMVVTARAGRFS